jgi:hypothetical protein
MRWAESAMPDGAFSRFASSANGAKTMNLLSQMILAATQRAAVERQTSLAALECPSAHLTAQQFAAQREPRKGPIAVQARGVIHLASSSMAVALLGILCLTGA